MSVLLHLKLFSLYRIFSKKLPFWPSSTDVCFYDVGSSKEFSHLNSKFHTQLIGHNEIRQWCFAFIGLTLLETCTSTEVGMLKANKDLRSVCELASAS